MQKSNFPQARFGKSFRNDLLEKGGGVATVAENDLREGKW